MFGLTGGHKGLQSVECNRFCLQGRPAASNRQQANTVNVASTYVNVPTHRCPEITPWSSILAPQITNKRSRTAFKMVDRTNSRSSQRSRGSINQWNGLTSLGTIRIAWVCHYRRCTNAFYRYKTFSQMCKFRYMDAHFLYMHKKDDVQL